MDRSPLRSLTSPASETNIGHMSVSSFLQFSSNKNAPDNCAQNRSLQFISPVPLALIAPVTAICHRCPHRDRGLVVVRAVFFTSTLFLSQSCAILFGSHSLA